MAPPRDMSWFIRMEQRIQPDGPLRWWERVEQEIGRFLGAARGAIVLDAGCGPHSPVQIRLPREHCLRIGIDIDRDGAKNPDVDHFVRASVTALPFRPETFDALVSSYVIEHLPEPEPALAEFRRVLKPGGRIWMWTSNLLNYSIGLARITPTSFHNWVRRLGRPDAEKENMATPYKVNLPGTLERAIARAGLVLPEGLEFVGGAYTYFTFSRPLFVLAAVGSRFARMTPLRRMRGCMIARCARPSQG